MASTENKEVAFRRFLADHYDKYSFSPLSPQVFSLTSKIQFMTSDLLLDTPDSQVDKFLLEEERRDPVYFINRNLWKGREHLEEILYLLDDSRWPLTLPEDPELASIVRDITIMFQNSLEKLVSFQDANSTRIISTVISHMPERVQKTLIRQHKEREMDAKAKLDDLVTSGASIGALHALLREQQLYWKRQLSEDFLHLFPTIDDDDWPMEEQKERYGPPLYRLTAMILAIRLFISLLWRRYDQDSERKRAQFIILNQAVAVYTSEFERFIAFISQVFEDSPFMKSKDFQRAAVAPTRKHEFPLLVEDLNSNIAWDFYGMCYQGKGKRTLEIFDIVACQGTEFRVEHTDASGNKTILLLKKLCVADKGSLVAVRAGCYNFIWDSYRNNYYTTHLRYKVVCTPPFVELEACEKDRRELGESADAVHCDKENGNEMEWTLV